MSTAGSTSTEPSTTASNPAILRSANPPRNHSPTDTVARCTQLVKRYGDLTAVAAIDLQLHRGECFGLLGPNGAGKTTTIEMMVGLTPVTSGHIELFGMRWGAGNDAAIRQRLGVVLQDTQLADKLTVEEVLRLFRSFYAKGRCVDDVITLLKLEPKRRTRYHQLSGGQKQRVALGVALVGEPELLFLDEPTTGLDPQARMSVWELVERYREGGGTVVLTTHYMEEAAHLCNRLAIMDHGTIIASGTPAELIAGLGGTQLIELEVDGPIDHHVLENVAGVTSVTTRGRRLVLAVQDIAAVLPGVLACVGSQQANLVHLGTHDATLDDVFVALTGRGLRDA